MKVKNMMLLLVSAAIISAVLLGGCKKDDDNNNNSGTCSDGVKNQNETGIDCGGVCTACSSGSITINSEPQAFFKANGTTYHFIVGDADFYEVFGAPKSIGVDSTLVENYSGAIVDDITDKGMGVTIGSLWHTNGHVAEDADFESVFQVGNYNYTADGRWGATVSYYDGTSSTFYYATTEGAATQSGSAQFTITHIQPYTELGSRYMKVRIEFSCTVYNSDNGTAINITDGVYVGNFLNF